jgi:flagellar hook-associated protein 1 FlgK
LPTRDSGTPFALASTATPVGLYYPGGGIPGVTLDGVDVTSQLSGGQIGANLTLRDSTMPAYQAQLDEFAQGLSSRFGAQGLTLFTDATGNAPTGGGTPAQSSYVGYAAAIQVNPAVLATPSQVRDGTAPDPNNPGPFTPNPPGGPAGFTTLISNVINFAMGNQSASGVAQPALNTSGLGAAGNLSAPFIATGDSLSDFATSLVAAQAQQSATTTSNLATEQALQTSLNAKITSVSGVNMDTEMSQMLTLQTAYSANARVIASVQSMYAQLLQAVQ